MSDDLYFTITDTDPRPFRGKTSWYELTDDERASFVQKRIDALRESDLPEATKQAAALRGAFADGLSSAAAFKRYVRRERHWYR